MINVFISIFVSVLIGVGFIGPIAQQVNTAASSVNSTGGATCTTYNQAGCENAQLYISSSWGASTLKMVPGFYALVILGTVVGGLFVVFRQVGIQ